MSELKTKNVADKFGIFGRKSAKLYDAILIISLSQLTGCGMVRRFLAIGDYAVEQFIRGKGGVIAFLLTAVFGALLLFQTSSSRSSEDMIFRKRVGVVLFLIGVFIMAIRLYLTFYYVGRKTPY